MATLTAGAKQNGILRSWRAIAPGGVGVEAGGGVLRLAHRKVREKNTEWELLELRPGDFRGGRMSRASLVDGDKRGRLPRGAAVCALSSPSLDIFPLNLGAKNSGSLDHLVAAHAREHLEDPLDDVVLDYLRLPDWARRHGDDGTTVLAFSAPREMIERILSDTDSLGLRITRIVTPACALAEQAARCDPEKRYLAVATGTGATSISVFQNGHVLLERILTWSEDELSRRLQRELSPDPIGAAALVENTSRPGASDVETVPGERAAGPRRRALDLLESEFMELASEASGCLGYCASFLRHFEVSGIILTGPLAGNETLRGTLHSQLGLEVMDPMKGLRLEEVFERDDGHAFATAACCAIWSGGGLP